MEYAEHLVQPDRVMRRYAAIYNFATFSIFLGYCAIALTIISTAICVASVLTSDFPALSQVSKTLWQDATPSPVSSDTISPDLTTSSDAIQNASSSLSSQGAGDKAVKDVILRDGLIVVLFIIGMIPGMILGYLCIIGGQMMRAFADLAVHTSPFLSPVEQAVAMGLRR